MATKAAAERVPTIRGLPRPLARALEAYADRLDVDAIRAAWELAAKAHAGQFRASGEPFITHAVDVATILAALQLDTGTVVSALVHDVVEDTVVSLQEIRELCGEEVAAIVDGVTKIGKVRFQSNAAHQAENYRKLLLSMVKDVRVILVKLADRLHNMRTLEYLRPAKRRPIARETREIYAPLAHRLGMAAIKWEMEDLAFKFLEPNVYDDLRRLVNQRRRKREQDVATMKRALEDTLAAAGIEAEVSGRAKHLWSIHRKMVTQDRDYDDIYDLMALRVITDSTNRCYGALGLVHKRWTPVPERFHDYIATPKSNQYQSLHTTVAGTGGHRVEIQIRTEEMHSVAEFGIAAHWMYKEGREEKEKDDKVAAAMTEFRKSILGWQKDAGDPEEFLATFRMDLFQKEIFVFTPQGDVKQLPEDSSPIDFAFAVHTEVGMHCAGARVNGRIAPLSRPLEGGDSVEIITNPRQRPNRDWLAFVKTSRARQRIRQSVRRDDYARALRLGRELYLRALRKAGRPKPGDAQMAKSARKLGVSTFDDVLVGLASGDIDPSVVIGALYPGEDPTEVVKRSPSALQRVAARIRKSNRAVTLQGMDNLMTHYSKCCQPVPGDEVIGYITRGRGITIHRTACPNVLSLNKDPGRRIEIDWKAEQDDAFFVHLTMEGTDRRGLLGDVAKEISATSTNIQHADMHGRHGGMGAEFVVEVKDLAHLERVIQSARRVKGVTKVTRGASIGRDELHKGQGRPGRRDASNA